jgi:hypothetical protein
MHPAQISGCRQPALYAILAYNIMMAIAKITANCLVSTVTGADAAVVVFYTMVARSRTAPVQAGMMMVLF